jgi:GAF domain-containing protein
MQGSGIILRVSADRVNDQQIEVFTRSLEMARIAGVMRAEALKAVSEARQMREYLTPLLAQMAEEDSRFLVSYHQAMLMAVLNAAMKITRADMANVQLVDPASGALHIEAQCGFRRPCLEYFDRVCDGQAACGRTFQNRAQVVVDEVAQSPIFLRTPALEVVLDAGVRAVQSTPLILGSGRVLGIISTHWKKPGRPNDGDLRLVHLLACNTAEWIGRRMPLWAPPGSPVD